MVVLVGTVRILLVGFTADEKTYDPLDVDCADVTIIAFRDAFEVLCIAGGVVSASVIDGVCSTAVARIVDGVNFFIVAGLPALSPIYKYRLL